MEIKGPPWSVLSHMRPRKQIRRKVSSSDGSDASEGEGGGQAHERAIAKLKAKRATVGKAKRPAVAAPSAPSDAAGGEEGTLEPVVPSVTLQEGSAQPVAIAADRYDSLRAVREQMAAEASRGRKSSAPQLPAAARPVSSGAPPSATLHDVVERYQAMLAAAREEVEQDGRELHRVSRDARAADETMAKLDSDLMSAVKQFDFFQENRRWVRALCGFLTSKSVEVAAIEAAVDAAAADSALRTTTRQAADLLDEIAAAEGRGDVKLVVCGSLPDPPDVASVAPREERAGRRRARLQRALDRLRTHSFAFDGGDSDNDALSDCELSDAETEAATAAVSTHPCAGVCVLDCV